MEKQWSLQEMGRAYSIWFQGRSPSSQWCLRTSLEKGAGGALPL